MKSPAGVDLRGGPLRAGKRASRSGVRGGSPHSGFRRASDLLPPPRDTATASLPEGISMSASSTAIGQRVALGRVKPGIAAGEGVNVGEAERLASFVVGGLIGLTGLCRGTPGGLL